MPSSALMPSCPQAAAHATCPLSTFPSPPSSFPLREGITPEQFWANSERLVGLANGGDRSAFEAATTALVARTKKTTSAVAAAASAAGVSADDGSAHPRMGGASTGGSSGARSAEDKGHRRVEEAWQPGGPDLHAVLGGTGEEARQKAPGETPDSDA